MAKLDDEVGSGLMGQSMFRAYRNSLHKDGSTIKRMEWEDLEEDQQLAWVSAAEVALDLLEDAENLPWTTLASHMFFMWARRLEYPVHDFDQLDDKARAAWVVAARHAVNLCALEGEELSPHEERWTGAAYGLEKALVSNE